MWSFVSRNVIFDEREIESLDIKQVPNEENVDFQSPNLDLENFLLQRDNIHKPTKDQVGENKENQTNADEEAQEEEVVDNEAENQLPRTARSRHPPERYGYSYNSNTVQERDVDEPKTYQEAINSVEAESWDQAMQTEYDSLVENNTWTLVDKPKNKKVLPGKWVYKVKYGPNGQVDKFKARYVAKGFAQVEGLDFFETYAPTCKPETFRILLAIAAQKDLHLGQLDVKSAYLHSPIKEEIFLEQPEGFTKRGESRQTLVCWLNKSIYGLKQAAKNWYQALTSLLSKPEDVDTYVLVAGENSEAVDALKSVFKERFKMDDRGELYWFLGMRVLRSQDKITIDQEKYIQSVLNKFNMSNCKPLATPAEVNLKLV